MMRSIYCKHSTPSGLYGTGVVFPHFVRLFTFNPLGIFIEKYLQSSLCLKMHQISIHISGIYGKLVPKIKIVKLKSLYYET